LREELKERRSVEGGLSREEFRGWQKWRGQLEAGGSGALSVLTDEEFFQEVAENLRLASAEVRR